MTIKILTFGIMRDIAGAERLEMELPNGANVAELEAALALQFPSIRRLGALFIAVNAAYANPDTVLSEHDEVALIPPVSGG
ncbi:MAG: MoaD/ThiS family protein [Saprospirales bacterium]|nr:MoaD/ThiS family protein [Saprospirales bacterium]MBK8922887.1 MoaD/ThiS family protein [Saprospirales bacterium]